MRSGLKTKIKINAKNQKLITPANWPWKGFIFIAFFSLVTLTLVGRAYHAKLHRLTRLQTHDRHDKFDYTQSVFLSVNLYNSEFQPVGGLTAPKSSNPFKIGKLR